MLASGLSSYPLSAQRDSEFCYRTLSASRVWLSLPLHYNLQENNQTVHEQYHSGMSLAGLRELRRNVVSPPSTSASVHLVRSQPSTTHPCNPSKWCVQEGSSTLESQTYLSRSTWAYRTGHPTNPQPHALHTFRRPSPSDPPPLPSCSSRTAL